MQNRIIIFHYHLNPGGVTRIIESQVEALTNFYPKAEVVVVCGGCSNPQIFEKLGVKLIVFECFNYLDDADNYPEKYNEIVKNLNEIIDKGDILHLHNLNLGKNPLLTLAFNHFVKQGFAVVNHTHDFAEDRPKNISFLKQVIEDNFKQSLQSILYPTNRNYQFATLNSFDFDRLMQYGVEKQRIHLVPNPVSFAASNRLFHKNEICNALNISPDKLIITYPVRVIQRKNIGEYILLCAIFSDKANWLVTQPPKNPVEIVHYEKWKSFCTEKNIPLVFEAGTKVDFEGLLQTSDFCFTTSVQEGFGMVYMEPWLLGTPVIGRNIPMVTKDIIQSGIEFPVLYNELQIIDKGVNKDFGKLSSIEQMNFISETLDNSEKVKQLFTLNPFLKNLLLTIDKSIIKENKDLILKEYSLEKFAERIDGIYREITF